MAGKNAWGSRGLRTRLLVDGVRPVELRRFGLRPVEGGAESERYGGVDEYDPVLRAHCGLDGKKGGKV